MTANNQGIMHAAFRKGGEPLCRNRNAHMSTDIENFRAYLKPCKRCAAKVAGMDARAAAKAARAATDPGPSAFASFATLARELARSPVPVYTSAALGRVTIPEDDE